MKGQKSFHLPALAVPLEALTRDIPMYLGEVNITELEDLSNQSYHGAKKTHKELKNSFTEKPASSATKTCANKAKLKTVFRTVLGEIPNEVKVKLGTYPPRSN